MESNQFFYPLYGFQKIHINIDLRQVLSRSFSNSKDVFLSYELFTLVSGWYTHFEVRTILIRIILMGN